MRHVGLRSAAKPRADKLFKRHCKGESAGRDAEAPIMRREGLRKYTAKGWAGRPLPADDHAVSQTLRVGRHRNERTEGLWEAEGRGPPGTRIFGVRKGKGPSPGK